MIYIKADISKELDDIDDVFLEKIKGISKVEQETTYHEYQS
jgi:hypothetical protein|tara:strand:+ start:419 stop:541 length:123 start_codon:yes stop_codon:yes gene_type:complete